MFDLLYIRVRGAVRLTGVALGRGILLVNDRNAREGRRGGCATVVGQLGASPGPALCSGGHRQPNGSGVEPGTSESTQLQRRAGSSLPYAMDFKLTVNAGSSD